MTTQTDSELRQELATLAPKTYCQPGCDGLGTYPEADSDGDPVPAQCQYCYEVRLPVIDKLQDLIRQREAEAEKRGRDYSVAQTLQAYMSGDQVDALTMCKAFANILIGAMCIDTNATTAEIKMIDLAFKGKPVGSWKVTVKQTKAHNQPSQERNGDGNG